GLIQSHVRAAFGIGHATTVHESARYVHMLHISRSSSVNDPEGPLGPPHVGEGLRAGVVVFIAVGTSSPPRANPSPRHAGWRLEGGTPGDGRLNRPTGPHCSLFRCSGRSSASPTSCAKRHPGRSR